MHAAQSRNAIAIGICVASLAVASATHASTTLPFEGGALRGHSSVLTAQAVVVPATPTSCSCGGFMCEGKEYPACQIQCATPQAAACECGYCERSLGAPSTQRVGPVANLCECR